MKHFTWTPQADLALCTLHESGFTFSGIAQRLGCSRLHVLDRAVSLGLVISTIPNSKLAALVAQARGRAA